MKKINLIYGILAICFAFIIGSYFTSNEIFIEAAHWVVVLTLAFFLVIMIVLPIFGFFKKKEKIYTIRKGKHSSGFRISPFIYKKKQKAEITFTDSCRYHGDAQLMEQINKAFGFGSINHLNNSIRLGWRYNSDYQRIDLFIYERKNGEVFSNKIGSAKINIPFEFTLVHKKGFWFGYNLFPYFGGKAKAPRNVSIKLKRG